MSVRQMCDKIRGKGTNIYVLCMFSILTIIVKLNKKENNYFKSNKMTSFKGM